MLARWWHTGPTVLIVNNHVSLRPPFAIPENLPVRNVVLFFDDVDRYCEDEKAVQRLDQTFAFFTSLCHEPEELKITIATARQEPEHWQRLRYAESTPPWTKMDLVTLPPLAVIDAHRLISALAQQCKIAIDDLMAQELASKNDWVFPQSAPDLSQARLAWGVTTVRPENIANISRIFQADLASAV